MVTTRYAMVPILVLGVIAVCSGQAHSDSLLFRIDPMLVAASHGPMLFVVVKNEGNVARKGTLILKAPEGWLLSPKTQPVEIGPGDVGRFGFNAQRAKATEENRYPLEVVFQEDGKPDVTYRQDVTVATAPYFSPTIDGKTDDWKDAVALRTTTGEGSATRETVVRTFWNRRAFSILIEVQEDELVPAVLEESGEKAQYGDAVQLAFGAEKPGLEQFEYLIVGDGTGGGMCYRLEKDGDRVKWSTVEKAKCSIARDGNTTRYECSIPFKAMRKTIRPSEGRAFCLSWLIHDPDGTGIRDRGASTGLWPCERSPDAWHVWWKPLPKNWNPFTTRIPWGMCSSKY